MSAQQDTVQYHLGLGGAYIPPAEGPLGSAYQYIHGSDSGHQVFNAPITPVIRWNAVVEVTGSNNGAANLIVNLEVHSGAPDGPLATDATFSGDSPELPANFSIGVSTSPGQYGSIAHPVDRGGPNMSFLSYGAASGGKLEGLGAGYLNWNDPAAVRAGIGRVILPDGNPGLGLHPTFDGKIDISRLPAGTYFLVLKQTDGVNVLRNQKDLTKPNRAFAKRADQHPDASIGFVVTHDAAPQNDSDKDGVPDSLDNCPTIANPDQANTDADPQGNACDEDDDNDGLANASDNCPLISNSDQADVNANGVGDACEADLDGDGVLDGVDNCPILANPDQADADKDGRGDTCDGDDDNDGKPNPVDNCPTTANPDQADSAGDGIGDACDNSSGAAPGDGNPSDGTGEDSGAGGADGGPGGSDEEVLSSGAPRPGEDGSSATPAPSAFCGAGLVESALVSVVALLAIPRGGRRKRR